MIKKYENKYNVVADVIQNARESKKLSKAEVCRKLQFYAVHIEPPELYKIENNKRMVKDFELLALCAVLSIQYDDLKEQLLHL